MTKIPDIKVSAGNERSKHNLSFDCSTTANFGVIQPTMAREMLPKSKFTVKVNSLVRLAPMPVPTFGRMFVKHTHVYVPYIDICPQFDSFIAGQPYKLPNAPTTNNIEVSATNVVYSQLANFNTTLIARYLLCKYADWTIYIKGQAIDTDNYEYQPLLITLEHGSELAGVQLAAIKQAWDDIMFGVSGSTANSFRWFNETVDGGTVGSCFLPSYGTSIEYRHSVGFNQFGCLRCGNWYVSCDNTVQSNDSLFTFGADVPESGSDLVQGGYVKIDQNNEYVTLDNADYVTLMGNKTRQYLVAFRLKAGAKRVRTIMQGLGYQFTPNLNHSFSPKCNWLKILAFYKAWFNIFRPKRSLAFTSTNCYDLIKQLESPTFVSRLYTNYNNLTVSSETPFYLHDVAQAFIDDLARDCYNYLPQDYFGMAVPSPNKDYIALSDSLEMQGNRTVISPGSAPTISFSENGTSITSAALTSPANIQMAIRVLKHVNKNTIAGKSIHDFIKLHYGVSIDSSHDTESVYMIGSCSIPIVVKDEMSNADTLNADGEGAYLGEYAGYGIGYNEKDNSFFFENSSNTFGVWLTLTSVMPNSGYYQGILRENQAIKRYDFFTSEFDALGYDLLLRSEISADYPVSTPHFNAADSTLLNVNKGFGFVPRYSHYKVGRNIVNGDLSLRSMRNDMAGFTLDRFFPYDSDWIYISDEDMKVQRTGAPGYVPTLVADEFRKIDPTDRLGQYNRIFYVNENREDHFIIHTVFDVEAYLPCVSLSESFDTLEDDAQKLVNIEHS